MAFPTGHLGDQSTWAPGSFMLLPPSSGVLLLRAQWPFPRDLDPRWLRGNFRYSPSFARKKISLATPEHFLRVLQRCRKGKISRSRPWEKCRGKWAWKCRSYRMDEIRWATGLHASKLFLQVPNCCNYPKVEVTAPVSLGIKDFVWNVLLAFKLLGETKGAKPWIWRRLRGFSGVK